METNFLDLCLHVISKTLDCFSFFSILFMCLLIYFCLHWVFVAVSSLSLVAASRGYSLVAVCRLLIVVASLVVEHRL